MFELDWKSDKINKWDQSHHFKSMLAASPVYLEGDNVKSYIDLNQNDLKNMIKRACEPYVPEVARLLVATSNKN